MIIVDTSVAIKWVVREKGHDRALELLDREEPLTAPDRMLPELVNALRRKFKSGQISEAQFLQGVEEVSATIDRFVPSIDLAQDASVLSVELDRSPYDCFFLACALSRGILVTADAALVRKCDEAGYGKVVADLDDLVSGCVDAVAVSDQIDQSTLEAIGRLTPLIRKTFENLRANVAGKSLSGGVRVTSAKDIEAGFSSPAYVALQKHLSNLDGEQIATLLALGWLRRTYHRGFDWPGLLANARRSAIPDDFTLHRRYVLAQMSSVPEGLAKLRAHFDIPG